LGQVETQLRFGDTSVNEDARSGGRLRFGYDLGDCSPYGVEFDLLGLGDGAGTSWTTGLSAGSPILARPIINAQTGLEDAQLVAYPELVDGRLNVTASSELYAAAALLRKAWYHRQCVRSNLVGGYRFFRFREGLGLEENLISRDEGGLVEIGTRIDVFDRFSAKNTFHGGELGLDMAWEKGPLSLELLATVALGNVHQVVEIRGLTRVRTPGDPATERTGGLLALPSNMGAISRDEFAALPQLGANLRWQVSDHLEVTCGYSWLLLTSAVQTGDQIDRTVDGPDARLRLSNPHPQETDDKRRCL
jgi:hypothetical protein